MHYYTDTRNYLKTVYVNYTYMLIPKEHGGDGRLAIWISEKDSPEGEIYKVRTDKLDDFMDDLESKGYDSYLVLEDYTHEEWNGVIKLIQ